MRSLLVALGVSFAFLVGCEEQPCDRYVDYICACHANDPEFDCEELRDVLTDADPDVQDTCAIDLAEQQDEDEANGLVCETTV